jgi:hypothetical protein
MKLVFSRSGGFAGPATTLQGEVNFKDGGALVTSDFGYQRNVAPEETKMLRALAKQLPQQRTEAPGRSADQYQYDVQIVQDDGQTQNLTMREAPSAGSENLHDWVLRECDRIWKHRIST